MGRDKGQGVQGQVGSGQSGLTAGVEITFSKKASNRHTCMAFLIDSIEEGERRKGGFGHITHHITHHIAYAFSFTYLPNEDCSLVNLVAISVYIYLLEKSK